MHRIIKRITVFLILTFFLGSSSFAQKKVLKFKNYSKGDGILHSYVLSIYQDKEGYIWIGSYGGLNRFDGTTFESYCTSCSQQAPTNVIHSILEPEVNKNNVLWMGTDRGLMVLNKQSMKFTLYEYESSAILSMIQDKNGMLWLGTEHKGLLKFDTKTNQYYKTELAKNPSNHCGDKIKALYQDNLDNIWIGSTTCGLVKYTPSNDSYERITPKNESIEGVNSINTIYKYENKLLLGTTGAGIFLFNESDQSFGQVTLTNQDKSPVFPNISGLAPDRNGDIWASTLGGGLYKLSLKNRENGTLVIEDYEQYTLNACGAETIASNILNRLYKDKTGNFWIGTLGGGLSKIDFYNHKFDHYRIEEEGGTQMDQNSVVSIGQPNNGEVWYGTQGDGIYIYSQELNKIKHIQLEQQSKTYNVVRQIYPDGKNVWASIDGGLYIINATTKATRFFSLSTYGLEYGNIHSICRDANYLWIGVYEKGLIRLELPKNPYDPNQNLRAAYYSTESSGNNKIDSDLIWAINKDKEGKIWVGTDKGLLLYNKQKDTFINVFKKNVSSISESTKVKSDAIWIGTYGDGIFLLNKTDFSHINFNTSNGLANNNINGILEDNNGHIWVGTEKGICVIDASGLYNIDLKKLPEEEVNKSRVKSYFLHDGLQDHEFRLNANESLRNGKLIFGGPKGLNIFDPQDIIQNTFVFPVKINDFKIYNESITEDSTFNRVPEYLEEINLPYKKNYFTIEFNQVCLSSPEQATYEYMLEGFDKDWITTDAFHRSITYTGIPEGDYVFKIKAINPDGIISDNITTMAIHISPPWYRTAWFLSAMIVLFIVLTIYTYRTLTLRSKRKHAIALARQQEVFENEKLKTDLDYKNRELSASAMYMINRNEKLIEIKGMVEDAVKKSKERPPAEMAKITKVIDGVLKDKDNWESFEKNFNLVDPNFTGRLMEAFPALSTNDVKICTYMRMNLSSKEIAGLLNIAPKSLETSRLRIRKKMGLETAIYLSDFILKF